MRLLELAIRGEIRSSPRTYQGRQFFIQLEPGREHPALLSLLDGTCSVILDPAELDPSGRTVLEAWHSSWEGTLVAVQLSRGGTEDSTLHVIEVASGKFVDGPIDRVRHSSIGWLPGGRQFYYIRRLPPDLNPGEERYHRRVYLHTVGRPADEDVLIFGAGRNGLDHYSVAVEPAGPWLVLTAAIGTSTRRDVWIADASDKPEAPPLVPVQVGVDARTRAHLPHVRRSRDLLYLQTTWGAPRGRVMVVDLRHPDRDWCELIPEDPEAVLTDVLLLDGPRLARPLALVARTRHAVSEIALFNLVDGSQQGMVPLPGCGVVGQLGTDWQDASRVWFSYTDPGTPKSILCYDACAGVVESWSEPAPAFELGPIVMNQTSFRSADGTEVWMFVLSANGCPDRPRPAILTGYGGFGVVMAPSYYAEARAWVRAGGVYAIACLRGGGEEGTAWHQAGMRAGKQKVFDDFEAAAECLLAEGWTSSGQLGIAGESNGGLLVGAVLTRHPEKYAAVTCTAPLLDMVRYENFGMGPSWRDEYGSAADPQGLATLLAYSPYHAVRDGVAYPAVLFAVFDGDSRVDPLHARKMCAALQAASTSARPILLRNECGVGHGARAVSSGLGLAADRLAFFADQLGIDGF